MGPCSWYHHPSNLLDTSILSTPVHSSQIGLPATYSNFFSLSPPNVLPYWTKTCNLHPRIHQGPLPFPAITPLCRHPRNPSCNTVMESLQDHNHHVRNHPDFSTIQKHCLYYRLINHLLGLDWGLHIPQHFLYLTPYPKKLPQVDIQRLSVSIIVPGLIYGVGEYGCCLKGFQVDPDCSTLVYSVVWNQSNEVVCIIVVDIHDT